ncbi:MAG: ABC transporter ATP-binding protein [Desulfurococcales archaeon]|nr:ABC transporter ATP-binding protein [Desulfurococcales archaeon]
MSSNNEPLVVQRLEKRFGQVYALKGINIEVRESEIFGLIGPNGAGKTTTLRIVATLLKPSSGDALVYGYSVSREPHRVRGLISYLPEDAGVYKNITGYDFLRFTAEIYAPSKREAEEMIELGARLSGLGGRLYEPAGTYSRGMKRRLLLARTLMIRPRLAILDEPTSGLDVYHAVEVREAIKRYVAETGAAVLLSSHNMLEVEYLCDRVAFISEGLILDYGTPSEVKEKYGASNLEEAFIAAVRGGKR